MKIKLRKNAGRFFSNFLFFIISFIFTFFLWFYIVTGNVEKKIMNLKLIPRLKDKLCIISYSPDKITINVEGKKRQILLLSFSKSYIDINYNTGKFTITLDESNIKFPLFIGKVSFFVMGNNELNIEIDSLIEKKVKVLMIQGLGSEPDSVKLIGPKKLIGNLNFVIPDSIPDVGKTTTITLGEKIIKVIPNTVKVTP